MNICEVEGYLKTMRVLSCNFMYYVSPSDKMALWWILDMVQNSILNGGSEQKNDVVEDILKAISRLRSTIIAITPRFGTDMKEKEQFSKAMEELELSVMRAVAEHKGIETERSEWKVSQPQGEAKTISIGSLPEVVV